MLEFSLGLVIEIKQFSQYDTDRLRENGLTALLVK